MPRGGRNGALPSGDRYNLGAHRGSGAFRDWDVDAEILLEAIRAVLGNGDGVLLSLTSDGGALSIQLYSNGAKQTVYCTDSKQFDVVLNTLKASSLD